MKVEHLIVDTNGFVRNLPLHEMGENIITTREVIGEIRDSATKQRLQALPYEIQYREPFAEDIHRITKLSKITGDYISLSAVDIQLIALAYRITVEKLGESAGLKTELDLESLKKLTIMGASAANSAADTEADENHPDPADNATSTEYKETDEGEEASSNEDEGVEVEDEEEDEEGWITPSNYKQKIKELSAEGGEFQDPDENTKVACLTDDFSMQNLMLHMNLKVLSSNGMLIRQLRTYILRCYTCFQTTSKMDKLFCPKCGHKTLKRVSVTVNPDGTQVIHLSRRVNLTGKGKKYPLPIPHGGKHANNPILFEDQPLPQQRATKQAMKKLNPLDFEYVAANSPFVTKDVYSRAAMLGINYHGSRNYWDKRNPNEPKKSTGRKKKNAA